MKIQYIALLCLVTAQAFAETAVVIDAKAIGEPPAVKAEKSPAVATPDTNAARMNSERMSPRQKAEIVKAEQFTNGKSEGEAFLFANRAKKDVVSLASGVQYKILRASTGAKPTDKNSIVCRYRGTLSNGKDFDKSDTKKPITLKVAGLLPGLKEAVKLMTTGSKWQIVIPPNLAYAEQGNQSVPPNAVLIYEMEILSVK